MKVESNPTLPAGALVPVGDAAPDEVVDVRMALDEDWALEDDLTPHCCRISRR